MATVTSSDKKDTPKRLRRKRTRPENTAWLLERRKKKDENRRNANTPEALAARAALNAQLLVKPTTPLGRTEAPRIISSTQAQDDREIWRELRKELSTLVSSYPERVAALSSYDEEEVRALARSFLPFNVEHAIDRGRRFKTLLQR